MNAVVAQIVPAQPNSPSAMIQYAMQNGADLDRLERMWTLQLEYEKNEARKAYLDAIAAFKENPPQVVKDMENKQYNSMYSSLANLVNTVSKALAPHKLSTNWAINQTDSGISVTCTLTHALGHSESATLKGPPDKSGSKNELQQVKSTVTYLKGATFEAVTGIVVSNPADDDDGNGAGPKVAVITEAQAKTLTDLIQSTGTDLAAFTGHYKIETVAQLPASQLLQAMSALKKKVKP